jgi:phosphatidylglycerophosphatase A
MSVSVEQRRMLFGHPAGWIALGLGSGLSPVAPGTAGSLAAIVPWLLVRGVSPIVYAVFLVATFALGIWACDWAVRRTKVGDPSFVVWDEFVGQWIALLPLVILARSAWWIVAGFILFRIFDIWKPWPVSLADRDVDGGLGVMLDDVVAGAYAAILLGVALVITR